MTPAMEENIFPFEMRAYSCPGKYGGSRKRERPRKKWQSNVTMER